MWLRPNFWSTLFALAGLVVLLSLGTWQLQRLNWKDGVLERLESRMTAAAVVMPDEPIDLELFEFRRVFVMGEFDHDREIYLLNRVVNGVVGGDIITPLHRQGIGTHILVDRGWVPQSLRDPTTRRESQVSGVVTVEAIVRVRPEKNLFAPDNIPARNEWYFIDPAAMAESAGIDAPGAYFLMAVEDKSEAGYPLGRGDKLSPRNDHLGYAITWYALAAVLLIVFVVYHRKQVP